MRCDTGAMKSAPTEPQTRVTVSIPKAEQRELIRLAAEQSIAIGRPVSVSAVTREAIRRGLGHAAA